MTYRDDFDATLALNAALARDLAAAHRVREATAARCRALEDQLASSGPDPTGCHHAPVGWLVLTTFLVLTLLPLIVRVLEVPR